MSEKADSKESQCFAIFRLLQPPNELCDNASSRAKVVVHNH